MSTLTLQENDLFLVRFSWSNLQQKSKNGQNHFMNKLFANMIISNPKLHSLFNSEDVVREQAKLFGEMISFTMAFLDDSPMLHDCMSEFVQENPSIVSLGINYIEPLGISLIQTFHQTLGKGKFSPQLEGLWVKVYLFLANALLQCSNDQSESRSLISVESDEEEVSAGEDMSDFGGISNIYSKNKNNNSNISFGPVKVKFQLSNNEKYRGFRRSANEAPDTELEAAVPEVAIPKPKKTHSRSNSRVISEPVLQTPITPVSSTSPPPFDPRKLRRSSKQPERDQDDDDLPAKNPRRLKPLTAGNRELPPRRMSFDRKELPTPPSEPSDFDSPMEDDEISSEGFSSEEEISHQPEPVVASKSALPSQFNRDPRRLQFKKPIPACMNDPESDEEIQQAPQQPFDPRKLRRRSTQERSSSSYTPSDSEGEQDTESVYSTTAPLFSQPITSKGKRAPRVISSTVPKVVTVPSKETNVVSSDEEEDLSLMDELLQITTQIPERTASREHPYSKGLAPIREADFDDDSSSKYDSENDTISNSSSTYQRSASSHDEVSSGASTLSLHNSDYRSSISSGNSSPNFSPMEHKKTGYQNQHQARQASQSSEISFMKPLDIPEPRTTYVKNATSYRVSSGFMRSSFVLQNMAQASSAQAKQAPAPVRHAKQAPAPAPAPVVAAPVTVKQASRPISVPAHSPIKEETAKEIDTGINSMDYEDDSDDDDCLDLINSFVPVTNKKPAAFTKPKPAFASAAPTPVQSKPKPQPQLRRTSRSNPNLQQTASRTSTITSQPIVLQCDRSEKKSFREKIGLSRSGSRSTSRANSLTSLSMGASTSDLCSVMSNDSAESTFSGFSFFSSQPSSNRRSSIDGRRRSIDSRAPKVPGASKYNNKIKSGRYSFFGSTIST